MLVDLTPFIEAIERGEDCAKLFDIRNELRREGATDAQQREMNQRLREIGCYISSSTRTDTPGWRAL